ncbi:L,D-transpeptidase [Polyangium spumosum]|uniref:L,D-transpeptidase family protein n=1 Tax=Polyangium spumosum TaxID=889282 RepID=A0A6N7PI96_9BACT|nr:L,D-transpeptidase [Polyangium spumosum]MRG91729.1 L,D-transpeptidase family protein [Polyangium spumosum]
MRASSFLATVAITSLATGCPLLDRGAGIELASPAPDTLEPAPLPALAAPPPAPSPPPAAPNPPAPPVEAVVDAPDLPPDPAAPADLVLAEPEAPAMPEEPEEPVEPAKEPPKKPEAEVFELASIAKETWIYAEPRWKSRRIGYLRAGAIVTRNEKPRSRAQCEGGWYHIEPRGYVCVGKNATLDIHHPVVEASTTRPSRDGLPYTYVMSRNPPPHLYARLPTEAELHETEPNLTSHLRKVAQTALDPRFVPPPPPDPLPGALLYGLTLPPLAGVTRAPDALVLGRAKGRSGFALLSTFDHDDRRYGLTTELAVLPIDHTRVVRTSPFSGLPLAEATLPVAFVKSRHATRYLWNNGALGGTVKLGHREPVPLTGKSRRSGGAVYLEARDGSWVREDQVVRIDPMTKPPGWALAGQKWLDVSILKQSLVAYEGTKPVYVTLVSTGADGLGDPKKTHSTIQGVFRIHTKHVSVTMDGDEVGDEFDLRDVPFVQYFYEGYALHAAYWHDDFGTPRSHGCVNLAPRDAAWLFNWTTPEVPETWHAGLSLRGGTIVYTHP